MRVTLTVPGKTVSPEKAPVAVEIVNEALPWVPQITPSKRSSVIVLDGSLTSCRSRIAVTSIKQPLAGSKLAPVMSNVVET